MQVSRDYHPSLWPGMYVIRRPTWGAGVHVTRTWNLRDVDRHYKAGERLLHNRLIELPGWGNACNGDGEEGWECSCFLSSFGVSETTDIPRFAASVHVGLATGTEPCRFQVFAKHALYIVYFRLDIGKCTNH